MSEDWYRNRTWNAKIAREFDQRLQRARDKEQYLRIQACTLATEFPEVALELLERYFALPDDSDHAQAYVDRAAALLALGKPEEAVTAYERALAREIEFPNLLTQAYIELPFLIATTPLADRYGQALELLEKHKDRLTFPLDHFHWNASRALILTAQGHSVAATTYARHALDAAAREHSGFRYHPAVGIVGDEHAALVQKLEALSDA